MYENEQFKNNVSNPKMFWNAMNDKLGNKNKKSTNIDGIRVGNIPITNQW